MKKIILALLTGLILLSACGKKDKPRLESFAGEAIATIQNQNLVTITLTDIFPTQWTPVVVANTPVVVQSVFPTNQVETDIASDSYPVPVPGSEVTPTTKTPTIIVSQSSPYPIGTSKTPKPSQRLRRCQSKPIPLPRFHLSGRESGISGFKTQPENTSIAS